MQVYGLKEGGSSFVTFFAEDIDVISLVSLKWLKHFFFGRFGRRLVLHFWEGHIVYSLVFNVNHFDVQRNMPIYC